MAQLHDEFNSRLLRAELPKGSTNIVAPFETHLQMVARQMPTGDYKDPESQVWRLVVLLAVLAALFALIPTVNLVNINISRIMERASEIGVRKAFGAPARTLVGQFLVENILLTVLGGLLGLVMSFFVIRALNESGMLRYAQLRHQCAGLRLRHADRHRVRARVGRLPGVADVPPQPRRRTQGRRLTMTRHLLRLIWNRKRQNFLLTLEIFFSFLAVFGVVLFAMHFVNNSRQPLGYDIDRVWSITVDRKENDDDRGRQVAPSRHVPSAAARAARDAAGRGRGRLVHQPVCELELGRRHAAARAGTSSITG